MTCTSPVKIPLNNILRLAPRYAVKPGIQSRPLRNLMSMVSSPPSGHNNLEVALSSTLRALAASSGGWVADRRAGFLLLVFFCACVSASHGVIGETWYIEYPQGTHMKIKCIALNVKGSNLDQLHH